MVKKVLALTLTAFLTASLGTSAFAASKTTDVEKTLAFIEETNQNIELEIEKAVVQADQLEADYLQDIKKLEEDAAVANLREQQQKLLELLNKTSDPAKKGLLSSQLYEVNAQIQIDTDIINEKITNLHKELSNVSVVKRNKSQNNDAANATDKILGKLLKTESQYNERTQRYVDDLNKLINDLDNTTRRMSDEAIQRGAENGIVVERYWTHVQLAERWVWIDPIRVVWK